MAQSILVWLDPSQIIYDPYPFVNTTEVLAPDRYRDLATPSRAWSGSSPVGHWPTIMPI